MPKEDEKKGLDSQADEQDNLFEDLLDDVDDSDEPSEEEKKKAEEERQKNKNAEEARKRREAEEKAKKEAEEKAKKEAEEKAKKEAEEKAKKDAEGKHDTKADRVNKLGEQLVEFKDKYPDVDLKELDQNKGFKKFINGKLLGKNSFTELYEIYNELNGDKSDDEDDEEEEDQNYRRKANSSSGSASGGSGKATDVYSEEELKRVSERMPYMNQSELAKIEEKFNRSVDYYDNKK